MTAKKGSDLLIKVAEADGSTFITLGGLRAKTIAINSGTVDVSDSDSAGKWRELLEGAELKNVMITGSGILKDSEGITRCQSLAFEGKHGIFQFVSSDVGTFQGTFQITSFEYTGDHNNEANYSMTFESAGEVSFSAT